MHRSLTRTMAVASAVALALGIVGAGAMTPAQAATTYSISGTVKFGDTALPPGVGDVRVWYASGYVPDFPKLPPRAWVPTAADGSFVIASIAPGVYSLYFEYVPEAQTYQSLFWKSNLTHAGQDPIVVGSKNVSGIDMVLPRSPVISGTVSLGSAGNAPGSTQVTYLVEGMGTGSVPFSPVASGVVAADGTYSTPVPQGWYRVTFWATGYRSMRLPPGNVWGSATATVPDAVLRPLASVTGNVWVDEPLTPPGSQIVDVSRYFCPADNSGCQSSSVVLGAAADGSFSIPGLADGRYLFTFTLRGAAGYAQVRRHVEVTSDADAFPVNDIVLQPAGSIAGHADQLSAGTSSPGYGVYVWDSVNRLNWTATADSHGDFRINGMPPGEYDVTLTPTAAEYASESVHVTVEQGATAAADAIFGYAAYFEGQVVDVVGRPVAAHIVAFNCEGAWRGEFDTDGEGRFTWRAGSQGGYAFALQPEDPNYADQIDNRTNTPWHQPDCLESAGPSTEATLIARFGGIIRGKLSVPGATGADWDSVGLEFERLGADRQWRPFSGDLQSYSKLTYEVPNVPPGFYRARMTYLEVVPNRTTTSTPFAVRTGVRTINLSIPMSAPAALVAPVAPVATETAATFPPELLLLDDPSPVVARMFAGR